MPPKQPSLSKKKDFENVFKRGRSFYAKFLGVKAVVNQLESNRFGIIVSAKVSKKAVERNKLKRRLRTAAREFNHRLKTGFDLALVVLPGAVKADYQTLAGELEKILAKLKLFK